MRVKLSQQAVSWPAECHRRDPAKVVGFVGLAGIQAKTDKVQVGSMSGKNIRQEELAGLGAVL